MILKCCTVHVANQNYSWVELLLNVLLEPTYWKGPFLVPKATPELNLDFLLWKSELKVPVVEKKLIPAWVPGPTLIQFSFPLYFYPRKFLWKTYGSLIVSWSVCQSACVVFCSWACCVALSDESRATGFKYKNTPDQNSFLRVTLKYCTMCIHVQLCSGWSNWWRSLRSLACCAKVGTIKGALFGPWQRLCMRRQSYLRGAQRQICPATGSISAAREPRGGILLRGICVWMIPPVYHLPLRAAFQRDIPPPWRECWSANGDGINVCVTHSHMGALLQLEDGECGEVGGGGQVMTVNHRMRVE